MNQEIMEISEDREDYDRFLIEYAHEKEWVQQIVENTADQIPMPPGFNKMRWQPSPIQGNGLFATQPIKTGEMLWPSHIFGKRTPAGSRINHSTRPNARFVPFSNGNLDTIAACHIKEGEEITIDYRQAASVNGNGHMPDKEKALETVRLRLSRCVPPLSMSMDEIEAHACLLLDLHGYIPTEFVALVTNQYGRSREK